MPGTRHLYYLDSRTQCITYLLQTPLTAPQKSYIDLTNMSTTWKTLWNDWRKLTIISQIKVKQKYALLRMSGESCSLRTDSKGFIQYFRVSVADWLRGTVLSIVAEWTNRTSAEHPWVKRRQRQTTNAPTPAQIPDNCTNLFTVQMYTHTHTREIYMWNLD